MLSSQNIERLELPPTRVTSTSATSIDMVCSNLNSKDINVEVITTGLSDHKAQISTINVQPKNLKLPSSTRRQYNQENLNQLKVMLSNVTWCDVYNNIEVDQAYDNFNNTLNLALNTTCPIKKLR
uniref:Endonuclease/exonuclease/phosphatase domain-containing protein n=1 Tax=Graphocephala atropunctata TaxID=36148 RepID=A0A1B6L0N8_9HEMI